MGSGGGGGSGRSSGGGIGGWFRDKVDKVKRFFGMGSKEAGSSASREDSYDPEKARMEETIRINNILTEFRINVESQSDKLEKNILDESRKSLDDLIKYLRSINNREYAGKRLNLNLERIQRENRKTEDLIHGYIKKKAQKRVSLDDAECLSILKMPAGKEKELKMTQFADSVIKEAILELSDLIKRSMDNQCVNLIGQIEDRLQNAMLLSKEKLHKSKEIEQLKKKDKISLQNEQVNIGCLIAIIDLADKQLEA